LAYNIRISFNDYVKDGDYDSQFYKIPVSFIAGAGKYSVIKGVTAQHISMGSVNNTLYQVLTEAMQEAGVLSLLGYISCIEFCSDSIVKHWMGNNLEREVLKNDIPNTIKASAIATFIVKLLLPQATDKVNIDMGEHEDDKPISSGNINKACIVKSYYFQLLGQCAIETDVTILQQDENKSHTGAEEAQESGEELLVEIIVGEEFSDL
jgi:hypothetical protein